jgi:hypothetical protein
VILIARNANSVKATAKTGLEIFIQLAKLATLQLYMVA